MSTTMPGPWNRLTVAFATTAVLLAGLAAWGWLQPGSEPGVPTRAAVTGLDIAEPAGGWRLAISPDGRSILKVEEGAIHMRTASDPEWDPDGRTLLSGRGTRQPVARRSTLSRPFSLKR